MRERERESNLAAILFAVCLPVFTFGLRAVNSVLAAFYAEAQASEEGEQDENCGEGEGKGGL